METTKQIASSGPLVDTLNSLHKWAIDSIAYIKRRNHLSVKEKAGAVTRFEQYKKYLEQYVTGVHQSESDSVERLLEQQFRFNDHARYYELPTYRLPDSVAPAHDPKRLMYIHVTGDICVNRVFVGDDLLCEPVKFIADLKPKSLLVLYVRTNYRTPREICIGLFSRVTGNTLFLRYDRPKPLAGFRQEVHYSLFNVVHLYKVLSIQRDAE